MRIFAGLLLLLLLATGPLPVSAAAAPDVVLLKGFWFADGFLADDPRYLDWQVQPQLTVKLYESPSLTAPVVGELQPGDRARIHDIAFEAYPGQQVIRAKSAATSRDGKVSVRPGDAIRLVCYQGDAIAAYVQDELVLVDVYGLKLTDQIRPEWRDRLGGLNQWLQLWAPDGTVGWAQFFDPTTKSARGRWQRQPRPVGGSHNFNVIVFSNEMPHFQRGNLLTNDR